MNAQTIWYLAKNSVREWNEDKALRLGAALSYYTVFSLAPLLILVIGIAGLVFGSDVARDRILEQVQSMLGEQGAAAIGEMLQHQAKEPSRNIFATIVGMFALLLGASGVVTQLQDALNTIWDVESKSEGIKGMIRGRLLSFAMVLAIGFLLLVSLIVSAGLAAISGYIPAGGLLQVLNFVVSIAVITVLFAMIFKFLPQTDVRWRDVWTGALVTAILFTIGKTLTGMYLAKSAVASGFGAAGSLVIILVWVYYNSQIVFVGAEFTQVYAKMRKNQKSRPDTNVSGEKKEESMKEQIGKPTSEEPAPTAVIPQLTPLERVAYFSGRNYARLETTGSQLQKKWKIATWVIRVIDVLGIKTSAKLAKTGYSIKKKIDKMKHGKGEAA